jgi:serine protease Do
MRFFAEKFVMEALGQTLIGATLGAGIALAAHWAWSPEPVSLSSLSSPSSQVPGVLAARSATDGAGIGPDFRMAASAAIEPVVHVKTANRVRVPTHPWLEYWGYSAPTQIQQGSGSGVIIDADGFILTNHHVIEGADEIQVSLNNRRTFPAQLVGADPATDLAILRIESDEPLPFIPFGDSDALSVGEWVLAVGNPFDLTSTVTAGIVSAKARNIQILQPSGPGSAPPIESFIQTDAAVNPGNSGGALVNIRGELVGINTAIASQTGSYAGYSFAVPSSIAAKVSADLIAYGRVQRAFLGVKVAELNEEWAEKLGVEMGAGVWLAEVTEGGGAQRAGLQRNDVLVSVEGASVRNMPELQDRVSRFRPGDKVTVVVLRDGKRIEAQVELRDESGTTRIVNRSESEWQQKLGVAWKPADAQDGRGAGALILQVFQGPFRQAGIQPGFLIQSVHGQRVSDAQDLTDLLSASENPYRIQGTYPDGTRKEYWVNVSGHSGTR